MKTMRLTKEHIKAQIQYEQQEGNHTFSMCRCGRKGCRGTMCDLCWSEKLSQSITKSKESQ